MGVPTIKTGPMTVEEYFAFTDTRPDNEKWELIDGEPILNASPSGLHQRILWNLAILLGNARAAASALLGGNSGYRREGVGYELTGAGRFYSACWNGETRSL